MVLFCVYYLFLQYIVSIKAWLTFLSVIFVDNLETNTVEHDLVKSTKYIKVHKTACFCVVGFLVVCGSVF